MAYTCGVISFHGHREIDVFTVCITLLIWAEVASAVVVFSIRRVIVADEGVWVSSLIRKVSFPLDAIRSIEEKRGPKTHAVTLHLDRDTPFGREIKFRAKTVRVRTGLFRWTRDAPAIEDLADASGADYEYVDDD